MSVAEKLTEIGSPEIVARFVAGGKSHFLPTNLLEIWRASIAMGAVIETFPLQLRGNILVISQLEEAAQFVPVELAAIERRMVVTNADATVYEGVRVEALLRRFNPALVFGVNAAILSSLRSLGHDPAALFKGRAVWARPDAYDDLRHSCEGCRIMRWTEFGPAVGLECSEADGPHVCTQEWDLEEVDGEIIVSSRLSRCLQVRRFPTGVRGSIIKAPCACGNKDLRVRLAP